MKKFLLLLFVILMPAAALAGTPVVHALRAGDVTVYDYGNIKLHAYRTGDGMADECYAVESGQGLVLIESSAFREHVAAFSVYLRSLRKPLVGAFLSYHPNGYTLYSDGRMPVYATEKALASWGEGGGVRGLTDSFIQAYGGAVAPDLPSEARIVEEGQTLTLAGVEFKILPTSDGEDYGLEIPAIKAVYRHMMGSKVHNILPSIAYIDAELADLRTYKRKGYALVLTSHHVPEGQDAVEEKIAYLEKVRELASTSGTKDEFTAAVKAAFPDYAGDAYLQMSADALYQ